MTTQPTDQDWQKQPGRLFLLANFITPQSLDKLSIPPSLVGLLGEEPEQVVHQLLEVGVLQFVDPDEPPEQIHSRIKVRELRAMLEARDLKVSGTKQELLNRLALKDPDALYRALLCKTQLQCTEEGHRISRQYLAREGKSLLSELNLPQDWWVKFIARVAEWIAAGVLGNAVYDALTKADQEAPRVPLPIEPEMVRVPAGSFLMGTSDRQVRAWLRHHDWPSSWFDDEQPQHRVTLPAFEIGRYPITNAEYAAFVETTGHRVPHHWRDGRFPRELADHPVRFVSWHDARAYAAWLRERTGQPYRLPTEAEWEKAARGTDSRIYPWGNNWSRTRCNTDESNSKGTSPVGQFSPAGDSPYGVADMAGNVWEWCSSLDKPYPYQASDGREDPEADGYRVLRGGSWDHDQSYARCASRFSDPPDDCDEAVGFRLVLTPALTS